MLRLRPISPPLGVEVRGWRRYSLTHFPPRWTSTSMSHVAVLLGLSSSLRWCSPAPRRAVCRFLRRVGVPVHTPSSSGLSDLSEHKLSSAVVPRATISPDLPGWRDQAAQSGRSGVGGMGGGGH